jgi:16S rRNA (uracil1498-N3)-methyltransferase
LIKRVYIKNLKVDDKIITSESKYTHLVRVLRLQKKDSFFAFCGDGYDYKCCIHNIVKKKVEFCVLEKIQNNNESGIKITLLLQISPNRKFSFAIQKATELGISTIIPIMGDKNKHKINLARCQEIIINACAQSQRAVIPRLHTLCKLKDIQIAEQKTKIILHPHKNNPSLSTHKINKEKEIFILVGSQSGFSPAELTYCKNNNWQFLSLGPRILRTETAPMVALTILQSRFGDI